MDIRPHRPEFAAEISGVDLSQPLSAVDIEAIRDAIGRYAVVFFRDQTLTNESQADFARHFGELEQSSQIYRKDRIARIQAAEISDVSNLDHENKPRARDDKRRLEAFSNRLWHSDASFRAVPGALSMLYAHTVPTVGGDTEFADLRAAWDALPDDIKAEIDGLQAEHNHSYSRSQLGFPEPADEKAALPPVHQPLVRTLPSGRRSLYMGSHASHIVGWPVPEGRMLLRDLLEHATEPRFVYVHHWTARDFVIWDNRCTLHRGRRFDESQPRDLRRVTTRDAAPALERAG